MYVVQIKTFWSDVGYPQQAIAIAREYL